MRVNPTPNPMSLHFTFWADGSMKSGVAARRRPDRAEIGRSSVEPGFGRYEPRRVTPASGDMLVRADRLLGRLQFRLVEPQSDDGLANWGFLADRLSAGELYPILRVPGG